MHSEIETLAVEAGHLALRHFNALATVPVEAKGHLDLVTQADQDVERFLTARLRSLFPQDGVFGEEGSSVQGTSGRIWVIDPIDGTFNFVRGGDQWAISIGLYDGREPVFGVIHAPARGQTLKGGKDLDPTLNGKLLPPLAPLNRSCAAVGFGVHPSIPSCDRLEILRFVADEARMMMRCCGSSTISLLELARGEVDGYLGIGESTWDVMATLPVLSRLGADNTINWRRTELNSKLKFACGTPEFLSIVAPIVPRGAVLSTPDVG